jgi:thioredoxin-related protein
MKKITVLFTFLLITMSSNAQVKFESSLTEAFKIAKEQKKVVFVEYYNSDCAICKKLGKLLETDTVVSKFYNKYFINYKMDTKGDADGNLKPDEKALMDASKLTFDHVPVLLFFDADKNYVHHSNINVESNFVLDIGKSALHPDYKNANNPKRYAAGDRSIRTLYSYSEYLAATSNDSLLKVITNDLYEVFSKDKPRMSSISSYSILKNVINSTENGFFIYWMENLDKLKGFENGYKKGQEALALEKILLKELRDPNIKNWSDEKKNLHKKYILKLKITDTPNVYFE